MPTYTRGSSGVVFVVDSTNRQRLREASEDLDYMLDCCDDRIKKQGIPVLILANKQDLDGAMSTDDILDGLQMSALKTKYPRITWRKYILYINMSHNARTGNESKQFDLFSFCSKSRLRL